MKLKDKNLIVVLGPTAAGKTWLGVQLAKKFSGEIISADSRQVYRGLDIGAGKDLDEYFLDGQQIPYHMIDIVELDQEYSVFDFQEQFYPTFEDILKRERLPIMVGGSGLYLESVLLGYQMVKVPADPKLHQQLEKLTYQQLVDKLKSIKKDLHNITDMQDRERLIRAIEIETYSKNNPPPEKPEIRPLVLGTQWEPPELRLRIKKRLVERLETGMIEEVQGLLARGVSQDKLKSLGLEYRYLCEYLNGEIPGLEELTELLYAAICQFARRQRSWFRRMERKGVEIKWINGVDWQQAYEEVSKHFK
jgi:tRNA dimethylallyltransferase